MSDKDLYVWERLEHHNYVLKEFQMKMILDNACYHGVQRCVSSTRKGKEISFVRTWELVLQTKEECAPRTKIFVRGMWRRVV